MTTKYTCENCGQEFRADRWTNCYSCGTAVPDNLSQTTGRYVDKSEVIAEATDVQVDVEVSPEKDKTRISRQSRTQQVPTGSLDFNALVQAQNRTTAAVRSLAVFFFYNLFWGAAVGCLVLLSSLLPDEQSCTMLGCTSEPNPASGFFLVLAAIVGLAGIWITMTASIRELRSSRTDDSWM
ncbi:MAG: hypothetical protein EB103_02735 [Actinobacteria bacterium]|nr:hypothetical protein [Actinomycetota bacterium]